MVAREGVLSQGISAWVVGYVGVLRLRQAKRFALGLASLRMTGILVADETDVSRLLRQRESFSVDFFENNIAAATEKSFAYFFA